jgi:hypothetical protein
VSILITIVLFSLFNDVIVSSDCAAPNVKVSVG